MSTTPDIATGIRPFHVEIPEAQLDDLRRRIEADALAEQGARRRPIPRRATGKAAKPGPILGNRVRLAQR